ncbi:hypothetical protein BDZ97DRAFT_1810636 [Flammula alnicola]|nr:hypothetical protein BDZ97DRAFT_1810636 [Flammula alnicola]
MCLTRTAQPSKSSPPPPPPLRAFTITAPWTALVGHCEREHPKACQDLARLAPAQIVEMKQRLVASDGAVRAGGGTKVTRT